MVTPITDTAGSTRDLDFTARRRKTGLHLVFAIDSDTIAHYCNGYVDYGPIPEDGRALCIPDVSGLSNLEAALAYAQAGWFVAAIPNGSKNPGGYLGDNWPEKASRDTEQIESWWSRWSDAGIAAVPGKSGAVVFDLDKNADAMPDDVWTALQTGQIQRTRTNDEKRGHYVFACGVDEYRNSAGGWLRFGEVKGRNGVIIVEPSTHAKADEGGLYDWVTHGEVPPVPAALRDLLSKSLPGDECADPKSLEELAVFLAAHTDENRPSALKGQLTAFATEIDAGASRHESMCKALVWALREAIVGCYSAQRAVDELRAAFESVKPESVGNGEFDRMACWAAAQAEQADPDDTRRRMDRHVWPAPTTPLLVAKQVAEQAEAGGNPLKRWRGCWHVWDGRHWPEISEEALRANLYELLAPAQFFKVAQGVSTLTPWNPDKSKLDKVVDALKGVVSLSDEVDAPHWFDARTDHVIACRNTLVRIGDRAQISCTADYFNTSVLPFEYVDSASAPTRWLEFLASVWPADAEAVALLQEWFGYVISGRTDLQKMMAIIGPTRSGKGTIDKVLAALVGKSNYIGTSAKYLQGDFGLEPLLNKNLAVFSDDRVTVNGKALVENFLKITGEDEVTVNRKYRRSWTGRLPTRIMLISNEIPTLPDNSRAIAGRMLWLRMTKSFLGQEDTNLAKALLGELPAILLWALDGLDRLNRRGEFTHASSGDVLGEMLADSAAPVMRFADEMCQLSSDEMPDPNLFVGIKEMYSAWERWCEENGHSPGSSETMGKALFAAFPMKVKIHRPRINGKQIRGYQGISLIPKHFRVVAGGPGE